MSRRPHIAICFFGIRRSIDKTSTSIDESVIQQAKRFGQTHLLAHFYDKALISNRRTGEYNARTAAARDHLALHEVDETEPEAQEVLLDFEKLKTYGDSWSDQFASLNNLVHQLHSLRRVTALAQERRPDIFAFIRPDLNYHDSLYPIFKRAVKEHNTGRSVIFVPDWQRWGGVNDRFAIAVGPAAAMAYGNRISCAQEFCERREQPLHSERLLDFALKKSKVKVVHVPHRASRVRANGVQSWEDFDRFLQKAIQWRLDHRLKNRSKPLYKLLTFANVHCSRLLWGDRYANIEPPKGVVQRSRIEEEALRSGGQ